MTLTVIACPKCRMVYVPDLAVSRGGPMPIYYYCEVCEKKFRVNEQYNLAEAEDAKAQSIKDSPSKRR